MEKSTLISEPKVFIIILNWNGKDDTCECLRTVYQIEYSNYDVVVVDNGSKDDSVRAIQLSFPEVTIIENNTNLGYAEGNNRGITYAMSKGCGYIFILNNDTKVAPDIIKNLLIVSQERPNAGVIGPKIYYWNEPNKIWFAGGAWVPEIANFSHIGYDRIEDWTSWNDIKPIDYVSGCALFIKSEVIEKIGLLEPKFFLTWEETDFCYRATNAGFECILAPSAKLWHKVSASFVGGELGLLHRYFMTRNRLLWIERNISINEKKSIYFKIILPEIKSYVRKYLSPRSSSETHMESKVDLLAVRDYLFRRFGDCPSWLRS